MFDWKTFNFTGRNTSQHLNVSNITWNATLLGFLVLENNQQHGRVSVLSLKLIV